MTAFISSTERDVPRFEFPAPAWRLAAEDIYSGLYSWNIWAWLAWHDIRQRYRRSMLGPFWITIMMGVTIGTIGFVFGNLFGQKMDEFLPYIAIGNIMWALLSMLLIDGCNALVASEGIIRQIRLPFSSYLLRMIWRNILIFAHNIWVFVAVVLVFSAWPDARAVLAIPGFALVILNGAWAALLLAMLSARFRDVPLVVTSALQMLYLATPIIWRPNTLSSHSYVYEFNPIYHLLELVRAPLLGADINPVNWIVGVSLAIIGWILVFGFFVRYRQRIPYWV